MYSPHRRRFIFFLLSFCLVSVHAHAQVPTPRAPLTLKQISPMRFGIFSAQGGQGMVSVNSSSGLCTPSAGATMLNTHCERSVFELGGQPGEDVIIMLPQSAPFGQGGLTLGNFTSSPANMVTIGQDGTVRFGVGATVTAPAGATSGGYEAVFDVQAEYAN